MNEVFEMTSFEFYSLVIATFGVLVAMIGLIGWFTDCTKTPVNSRR